MSEQLGPEQRGRPSRLLLVIVLVLTLLAIWLASEVFLVGFGGIVVAVFFNTAACAISSRFRLSYGWALGLTAIALVAAFVGLLWLTGTRIAEQMSELAKTLPKSYSQIRDWMGQSWWGEWLLEKSPDVGAKVAEGSLPGRITGAAGNMFHFLVDLGLMGIVGIYLAAEPEPYRDGAARLFPLERRARVRQIMQAVGFNLRWWLIGQLFSMFIVTLLIGGAMWAIGMPLALVLGLLAGLFEMVPTVGPIVWLIPASLVALVQGTNQVVHVFLVYCGLHLFESYVLVPYVQRRAVYLPPAFSILAIMLMGVLAGVLGIVVAAPAAVAAIVLVKTFYVQDKLGDREVRVPGEDMNEGTVQACR